MKKHHVSFKHAWDGIFYNLTTQPNFRFHLLATLVVIIAGFYFQLSSFEWLILAFTISLVIVAEMLNTAIESMVDLLTSEHHLSAKIAKDTSAGMVLVAALTSVIVGLVVFLPHILPLLRTSN